MFGMFYGLYALSGAGPAHRRAGEAEAAARRSEYTAAEAEREVRALTERLDKLILINMSMWSLLQERTGVTEEQLMERVQEIDMRDGVLDGKITRMLQKCTQCGRTTSRRHRRCLFCGGTDLKETAFDGV